MPNELAIAALMAGPSATVRKPRRASAPKPVEPRDLNFVITPADFDRRVDKLGRPYAWVRGTLLYRKREKTRTVMVQGEAYHLIQHLLGIGTSLKIHGVRENIVDRETGRPGAEVYRAKNVLKVFDAEGREIDGTTGLPLRSLREHDRQGHYRGQHYGPANSLFKVVWIDDVQVNGGRIAA